MTKRTLQGMRTDENFTLFWQKVNQMASNLEAFDPVLQQKRKAPRRFELGNAPLDFCTEPMDYYRRIYWICLYRLLLIDSTWQNIVHTYVYKS